MSRTDPIRFTIGVGDNDSAYPILIEIARSKHWVKSFEDANKIVDCLNDQLSSAEANRLFEGEMIIHCPFSSGSALVTESDAETIMTVLDTFVSYSEELEEWVQDGDEEEDDEDLAEYLEFSSGSSSTH